MKNKISRYICIGKEVVLEEEAKEQFPIQGKSILLIGNNMQATLMQDMVTALQKRKCRVATLLVNLGDEKEPERIQSKMVEIHTEIGSFDGIINIQECMSSKSYQDMSYEETEARIQYAFLACFIAVKELYEDIAKEGAFCAFAGSLGGIYGTTEKEIKNIWFSIQAGFLKSIQRDFPTIHSRIIDFDSVEDSQFVVNKILEEIASVDPYMELAYKQGKRYTLIVVPEDIPKEEDARQETLDEHDVILFSGGGRGILYEMAKEYHSKSKATFILTGRTAMPSGDEDFMQMTDAEFEVYKTKFLLDKRKENLNASVKEMIEEYQSLKSKRTLYHNMKAISSDKVVYYKCDTSKEEEVIALRDKIKEKYGHITGVINGAGVPSLMKLKKKKIEECYLVLMTKCMSFYNLFMHLKEEPLKFFDNVGSISGRFGMDGQADYCAASDCLAKMTTIMRKEVPFRLFTSDWSAWEEVGMAMNPSVVETHAGRGVEYIPVKEGTEIFIDELEYGTDVNEILYFGNIGNDYLATIILQYVNTDTHKLKVQWDNNGGLLDHTKYPYVDRISLEENRMKVPLKSVAEKSPLLGIEYSLELYKLWKWRCNAVEPDYPFFIRSFYVDRKGSYPSHAVIETRQDGMFQIYTENEKKSIICEMEAEPKIPEAEHGVIEENICIYSIKGCVSDYLFEDFPYVNEVIPTRFLGKLYDAIQEYSQKELDSVLDIKEVRNLTLCKAIHKEQVYNVRLSVTEEKNVICCKIFNTVWGEILSAHIVCND